MEKESILEGDDEDGRPRCPEENELHGEASLCLDFSKQQSGYTQHCCTKLPSNSSLVIHLEFRITSCQDELNQFFQVKEQREKFQIDSTD